MERTPLPIDAVLPKLLITLAENPNAVLAAPPGAGKTTRVPLALLEAPWRGSGKIVMLEPRRIAARAAAERLASELGEKPGQTVGYQIRGESRQGKSINVVTEGVLTRMIQSDPELPGVAAILFDEAHERSIHSELGLALSLDIQGALRPDLRLLVMSATLDTNAFAKTMGEATVIESPGKIYPVETHWLPRPWKKPGHGRRGFEAAVADLTMAALNDTEGDVLVFLPGVGEINRTQALIYKAAADIQILHGSLPFRDQAAVLKPAEGRRRIILSTAIAETSLTVPGVRVVVDGGLARRARTDPSSGLSRLVTGPVSRAQADQRRGRAGRLGPGICFRLWTKGEEGGLPAFAPPEILETELSALVLELALWGVQDPKDLAFLTPPPEAAIVAAKALLTELGALGPDGQITAHGRTMATKPMHPRLAHMMSVAESMDLKAEAALMAALLSERDPFDHGAEADLALRLKAILGDRNAPQASKPAIERIKTEAKRHAKALPRPERAAKAAGVLASLAYPDRIARRRDGEAPRFILSGGRGAVMQTHDPLAGQAYLVATDLEDGTEARIRTAAPVTETELRRHHGTRIIAEDTVAWSPRHRRVEARQREMLGAAALTDRAWKTAPPELLGKALADGVRQEGPQALPWPKSALALRARVAWLRQRGDVSGLPDWSDAALAEPNHWLTPHLTGLTRIEQIADLDLTSILKAGLDWEIVQTIDRDAPPTYTTPLGRRIAIDYALETPSIALKVQELYGVTVHPSVGMPPVPLAVELLSPANRPVQKTADLPGFWQSSYKDVRKDMRARYPKHHWPEYPMTAQPMERTRK
ncbi:MAG: ATP-dependent helicase HrpB [Pseudomonadota bacterium]